ncbi:MAG TPA: peptide deformylase [Acidimicrobiales bacterium]|nr:peptide deformylase [Acidimicrobiales bacterium]
MAVFPIRTFGDPVLRLPCAEVTEFDADLRKLADDMLETMYDAPGVGLAANQVGVQKRLFVFDVGDGPGAVVNPVLSNHTGEWEYTEGCLSVPELAWPIVRFKEVRVDGFDLYGNALAIEGDELMARMLQHEVDHLNGLLLLSHLDRKQYKDAMRTLRRRAMGLPESGGDREPVG